MGSPLHCGQGYPEILHSLLEYCELKQAEKCWYKERNCPRGLGVYTVYGNV